MKSVALFFLLFTFCFANAQPFAEDIAIFKKQDSVFFPPKNAILFIGSSSFTNWKDVQDYFPKHTIINRGFGGSSLLDVIRYADKIIFPYKPKQIVIYCGENDVAGDSTITSKIVFQRFLILYYNIRTNLGNIPISFISMKPSPSRWHMRQIKIDGNKRIAKFLKKKKRNGTFINVWNSMLDEIGKPNVDLFLSDMLHMNVKGYTIWQKIIQPHLL